MSSDPGFGRLRMAVAVVVGMGTALAVEYGFATWAKLPAHDTLVVMLLGAVVAMIGSTALSGTAAWPKVRTAIFFPVAIGVGLITGILVAGDTDLMLGVFVAVMFVAVFVRRFGMPFFSYGFLMWMGYFFASLLNATIDMLPILMAAVTISSAWLLLLSLTVLGQDSRRTFRQTLKAFDARTRAVARACSEVLSAGRDQPRRLAHWQRRLSARQAGLSEAALIVEGWAEDVAALPPEWSGSAVRRRLLDVQQTLDRLAGAARALAGTDPGLVTVAIRVTDHLAQREDDLARAAAIRLAELADGAEPIGGPGWWPARQVALAALEFLELDTEAREPPRVESVDDFQATESLTGGNLPGSAAMARNVPARGTTWNPLARLDMTTRQAFQVAIAGAFAILIGRELSTTRYYWAVIAAFVAFAGTATRSETLIKGANRIVGTLFGLFVAIWLADLTAGHTVWVLAVILGSMFCGFYLIRISYAYLIFFITIMVSQLYSVLHEFSDALLVLRLGETAIGAAIGIAVAVVFTPLSTRDTVRAARDNLLTTLGELLDTVSTSLDSTEAGADLDALSRALDDRARQLALVAKPLTGPVLRGSSTTRTRQQLSLYSAIGAHARALTVGLRQRPPGSPQSIAAACQSLAEAATRLSTVSPGQAIPSLTEPLRAADSALFLGRSATPGARASDPVVRSLTHISDALAELAAIDVRARTTDERGEDESSTRPCLKRK